MSELRFDGKVAIVTGAGGGLGRSHALLLASRGAKVVVNDLGGSHTGEGQSQNAADKVVAEIVEAGGEAVANYDSVEDGDKIVKTAVDSYGRVDIVINNAGILRDVSFHKMSQTDWDLVYKVHVLGSFRVTHAAWPLMREQGYGRIVMTASAAGIYGNFGQANYSMAKLGLVGLSNTLAQEGRRKNIHVNTIAPIAGSRMTETVLPPDLIAALKPEYVSPLVAKLVHEDCEETGGLYEVGGGFYAKLRWERSAGKVFRLGRSVSIEDLDSSWGQIGGFDESTNPGGVAESMQPIMENVQAGPSKGGNKFIDVDEALGYEFEPVENSYSEKDLSLYALGVGAATNPTDEKDLQLVFEMHGGGMKAVPTYGVIPALNVILELAKSGKQAPGLHYGLDRILHGEQFLQLDRPLPRNAKLTHKARIKDIFDKGKGALVVTAIESFDEDGDRLTYNEVTTFIRGAGGWGGDRGPSEEKNPVPDRAPDQTVEEKVPENQALLYRLSGDWNPLHADPGFAKAFGFDKPILHGLCTFGFAGRHVFQTYAPEGNPEYFKSVQVRFADSVFPGETLVTEMWKESDTRIVFRTKVKERDSVVISNAAIELFTEIPKKVAKPKKKAAGAAAPATPISADLFNAVRAFVAENPDEARSVGATFQFQLSSPSSVWTLDMKKPEVVEGEGAKPDCTLQISDADFMAMSTGKADPMKLFSSGKLKISGDIMASQKLSFLQKIDPKMVMAEMEKRAGSGGSAGSEPAAANPEPTSWDVFIAIRDHIESNQDLAGKVGASFLFKLANPASAWTVDLKSAPGSVSEGGDSADCILDIAESDFLDMVSGKSDPMKLFSTGKLRISGDVMASQKLSFLQKMDPEKARAAVARARAEGQGPSASAETSSEPAAAAQAPAVFEALGKRFADNPALAGELGGAVAFRVSEPDGVWTVAPSGSVETGAADGVIATLSLADADLAALVKGEATAQSLYQHGQLRVDGDVSVAHRLGVLKDLL